MVYQVTARSFRLAIFLRGYKSGPLPKLFKVIPSLPAWARILALTKPEQWSPHACRAATRTFVSTMKPPQAQLFLSFVLLDAIREDIQSNKKLNVQFYECLKRALYKPGAFFKGIVFPMLEVSAFIRSSDLLFTLPALGRMLAQGSGYHSIRSCQKEGSCPSFSRSIVTDCPDGLHW